MLTCKPMDSDQETVNMLIREPGTTTTTVPHPKMLSLPSPQHKIPSNRMKSLATVRSQTLVMTLRRSIPMRLCQTMLPMAALLRPLNTRWTLHQADPNLASR